MRKVTSVVNPLGEVFVVIASPLGCVSIPLPQSDIFAICVLKRVSHGVDTRKSSVYSAKLGKSDLRFSKSEAELLWSTVRVRIPKSSPAISCGPEAGFGWGLWGLMGAHNLRLNEYETDSFKFG
jgi:hypothetical protein